MGTSRKECWETCWWVWSTVTLSAPVLSSFKHLWTLFQTDEKFSPAPPWLRRARNPNCHRRGCFQYFTEKLYILLQALWLLINCLIVDSNRSRKKKNQNLVIFTSAEREVKDSRRSAMYQSCLSLTRLGLQSLYVFGFIRLFDEVRAELVRDISRSLRFLWFIL